MRPIRVITGNRCSCMLFSILLMMGGMVIMLSRLQILNTYGHFNNFGLESGDGVDFSAQNGLCQCVPPMVAPPVKNPKSIANSTLTDPNLPTIYIITPTYPRLEQIPELTRLGHTLMHVPKVHWIVADDTLNKSADVENVLRRTDVPYTYLVTPMPAKYRNKTAKPKGVSNRLAGIQWLQKHGRNNGVFYFADDDNTYDLRLFEEMRYTKKVAMWPVGLVTHIAISSPVVRNGKVIDFYDGWKGGRKFPVDMAGFAVNVAFMKTIKNVTMPFYPGYEEDGFLKSLNITLKDIEPKADNCTKVYVWHTKTKKNKNPDKVTDEKRQKFTGTNIFVLPNVY